ncbi:MAG: hypothetical protein U1E45_08070 [Geminicoccaceae bacterium]
MAQQIRVYRDEGKDTLIEISLGDLRQLFNSLDPAPFRARDLDGDAEEYIVGAAGELPIARSLRLVIHVPAAEAPSGQTAADVQSAVRNYFVYRGQVERWRLAAHMRDGRLQLALGLPFLAICVGLSELVMALGSSTFAEAVSQGFIILGWVALWRPAEVFLYDWWPMRRQVRLMDKLGDLPVEIRTAAA